MSEKGLIIMLTIIVLSLATMMILDKISTDIFVSLLSPILAYILGLRNVGVAKKEKEFFK